MNMVKMMKQVQEMQKSMEKVQAELGERNVEFSSGGGAVKVIAKGDGAIQKINIDASVVDPKDVEMLEDLVLSAVQGAIGEAKDMMANEMGSLTKDMKIPGLPF